MTIVWHIQHEIKLLIPIIFLNNLKYKQFIQIQLMYLIQINIHLFQDSCMIQPQSSSGRTQETKKSKQLRLGTSSQCFTEVFV